MKRDGFLKDVREVDTKRLRTIHRPGRLVCVTCHRTRGQWVRLVNGICPVCSPPTNRDRNAGAP